MKHIRMILEVSFDIDDSAATTLEEEPWNFKLFAEDDDIWISCANQTSVRPFSIDDATVNQVTDCMG